MRLFYISQGEGNKDRKIIAIALYVLIILSTTILVLSILPQLYDLLYGDSQVTQILNNIIQGSNPDDIALSIMRWEKEYFYNPYSMFNPNSTLQKIGLYKINGSYRLFVRNAPVSWVIHSRLANCGEYAKVFVYLMNKKGILARIVHTPGEDHAWAEYMSNGFKIVVDPSSNRVILDKRKFAKDKNWSYIESYNISNVSDRIDVSDEYIERGKLNVYVLENGNPKTGVYVVIKSPHLMRLYPSRYTEPRIVVFKKTDKNGSSSFKLGEKEYIVEVRKNYLILDMVYSKNITVKINEEVNISFDLAKEEGELRLRNF